RPPPPRNLRASDRGGSPPRARGGVRRDHVHVARGPREAALRIATCLDDGGRDRARRHGHLRLGRRRRAGDAHEARRQRDLRRLPDVARDRGRARGAGRDRLGPRRRVAVLEDLSNGQREPRRGYDAVRRSAARRRLRPPHGGAGLVFARRQTAELPFLDAVRPSHPQRAARGVRARRRLPVAHAGLLGPLRSRRRRLGAARLPLVRQGRTASAHARRSRRGPRAFPRRPDRSERVTLLGAAPPLGPLREALRDAPADEADIHVHRRRAAITRYSHSSIHQNAVSDETHATVRAIVRRAVGAARTNPLAPADLRRALADAASLARASRPDDEWPGVADPEPIPATSSFHEETAATSAQAQAEWIGAVCDAVPKGMRAAGTSQIEVTEDAVANTRGVAAYAPATMAYLRALVLSDSYVGSGYAEELSMRSDALHPKAIAARAAEKCALDRDR